MSDCLNSDDLDQYLAIELPDDGAARVESHLAACPSCRRRLEARRRAYGHLLSEVDRGGRGDTRFADEHSLELKTRDQFGSVEPGIHGDSIDRYRVIGEIHRGGQGIVYKALQTATKRTVALKVLLHGRRASARQLERFHREVRLIAALRHPNIVTVYDSGVTADGRPYYAMEYIHGKPVDSFFATRTADVPTLLITFRRIAAAVGYAHQHGVIHRDLKPANVLVDTDGEPHVVDFGLAKVAGAESGPVTATSEFMGTLAYASPEQLRGDPATIDIRTDVYSLGVMFFRELTGQFPYVVDGSMSDVIRRITEHEPPRPSKLRPKLDDAVDRILLKAMAKDKERRYQSAGALADDLDRYLEGRVIEAKRDSVAYVVRVRARSLFRNHPLGSFAAVLAVGILAGYSVARPLVYDWTGLNAAFERFAENWLAAPSSQSSAGPLKDVRVIALNKTTNVEILARREGLRGVSAAEPKSLRRLHGRLMEQLATFGVQTVVWDIAFREETEFDEDFVRGLRRLQEDDVDVVVAEEEWWANEDKPAQTSSTIWNAVRDPHGHTIIDAPADGLWSIPVLMERPIDLRKWSLALAAVASFRHPGTVPKVELYRDHLAIQYWSSDPTDEGPQHREWLRALPVEVVDEQRLRSPKARVFGLQEGDELGIYVLSMPVQDVLDASTLEYADLFDNTKKTEVEEKLENKIVVLGDFRDEREFRPYLDGRRIHGCYAHAVGIQQLLQELETPRRIQTFRYPIDPVAGAAVGVMLAILAGRRRAVRLTAEGVAAVLACAASVLLAKMFVLWNPLVFLFALVVACECAAVVRRQAVWPWRPSTRSTSS